MSDGSNESDDVDDKDNEMNCISENAAATAINMVGSNLLNMTVGGAGLSDDEANSWEDEMSDSEAEGDDYDEEDYDEEGASPQAKCDEDADDERSENEERSKKGELEEFGSDSDIPAHKRLIMNVHCTEYDVVKKVGRKFCSFKLKEYPEDHDGGISIHGDHNQKLRGDWDISWHDLSISADFLAKMHQYQKINHYPGMYVVTRKNHLARNLMRMKRLFKKEYNFFPATWVLPGDNIDFRNQFNTDSNSSKQTYIVKPDGLSQGKGIFLSRRMDHIINTIERAQQDEGAGGYVVQHYMDHPHLVDDLKYDLRIYVLLYGVNPLRIYIHDEGMVRFCTEPYHKPSSKNMDNLFMHLTNYAINKFSDAYEAAEEGESEGGEGGHKRSLNAILNILEAAGCDRDKIMKNIKDIIVKTLIVGQPYLSHLYRSCQPEDLDNSMCF